MKYAAVILAGGASTRMGTPKALLEYCGETFLDRLVRLFSEVCNRVVVVLGHDADTIRAGAHSSAEFVFNEQHTSGQVSSLQCGLRAAERSGDAVFFTPVDYPAISPETPHTLVDSFRATPDRILVPRYDGRHGHPVLIPAALLSEFLTVPRDVTARDVMHKLVASTVYVDVNDPGILRDVDDPAAYSALKQAGP